MAEITNEQKLYVLLGYKKYIAEKDKQLEYTEKDERIAALLRKKAKLGIQNLRDAEAECTRQGWLRSVHVVEELGYTTHTYNRMEIPQAGLDQIGKFWRESKYNPRNVWLSRAKIWIPIICAILTAAAVLVQLYITLC